MISMYQNVEEAKQKIIEESEVNQVKSFQLLQEISFSNFYGEF